MESQMKTNPASRKLTPPISKINALKAVPPILFPAISLDRGKVLRPNREPTPFLALELKTPRLNNVHQHLWLAGLPTAARPLHRQKLLGRSILITEDPDEHLIWFETYIFIKPLPESLFSWNSWIDTLCADRELHEAACGLLLSYAWLVRYRSDLDIAKEHGLLPKEIEWAGWVTFLDVFLDNINLNTLSDVSQRYKYGELRLSRLNVIYRLVPPTYSLRNFVRGYQSGSTWYAAFFEYHFKWMLAVFASLSVSLSALQVGLATNILAESGSFQKASYGFTVLSLIAVLASVALVFLVWLSLFLYHLLATWRNDRVTSQRRLTSGSSP